MIDNMLNNEIKKGNSIYIKYGRSGDSLYTLTCANNEENYYTINEDNGFIIIKRYSPSLKKIIYIPLSSVISISVSINE